MRNMQVCRSQDYVTFFLDVFNDLFDFHIQLLTFLGVVLGLAVGKPQHGGQHYGYDAYGSGGFGYGGHHQAHGHGYTAPIVKAVPIFPKVKTIAKTVDYYVSTPHFKATLRTIRLEIIPF